MNIIVLQMRLCIPAQKVSVLLQRILTVEDTHFSVSEKQGTKLCQLLERYGWSASEREAGAVLVETYRGRELDLEQDPVLTSLTGIVPAGNFLVGFSQCEAKDDFPWYILYTHDEKQVYQKYPSKQALPALLQCPSCGSVAVQEWHYVEYTAIVYPVISVNSRHIRTAADVKDIQFESVIKAYVECACGEEVSKDSRTIEVVP